jgi:hypothetical protein
MEKCCVFFEVRTECLNITETSFGFKGLNVIVFRFAEVEGFSDDKLAVYQTAGDDRILFLQLSF